MNKIDEKTSVPISWVAIVLVLVAGWAIIASTWVKGVNDRLGRIEAFLHISDNAVASSPGLIKSAMAKGK